MKALIFRAKLLGLAILLSRFATAQLLYAPKCEVGSVGRIPACQFIWEQPEPIVFIGVVKDVKDITRKGDVTSRIAVTFNVTEQFLGTSTKSITVYTGGDECGMFPFSRGVRYLVYAHKHPGEAFVHAYEGALKQLYSGDKTPDWDQQTQEDLQYLRSLATLPNTGEIFGTAFKFADPDLNPWVSFKALRRFFPAALQSVTLEGARTYRSVVNRNGDFQFMGVPPGKYTVTLKPDGLPAGTYDLVSETAGSFRKGEQLRITVAPKGCVRIDFRIDPFALDTRRNY